MNRPGRWTKGDAWFRREVGDGSFLTVSRHAGGQWSYRWIDPKGGQLAGSHGFRTVTAAEAMARVDGLVAAVLATECGVGV